MEDSQVVVYGNWASLFVYRVIWALKLKGVKFESVEEDLTNKSSALLNYNPVHKKVPVLLHGGKPVVESTVILEYIEEAWPDQTPLLPKDPYQRAVARFWIDFGQQKSSIFFTFFRSSGEEREKAAKDVVETLRMIEDEGLGDKKFFGGNTLSLVDLCFGWLVYWFESMEELVGLQVVEPSTLPRLHQWTLNFKQEPLIKENLPDKAALLEHYKGIREARLSLAKNN
ncbi:hypothetical protein C2S51_006257 [Perilla frutescens var. frutescens]|nr:hypothetical protein C2S51_006257 [Perilla frutescens var. frutescens]